MMMTGMSPPGRGNKTLSGTHGFRQDPPPWRLREIFERHAEFAAEVSAEVARRGLPPEPCPVPPPLPEDGAP